jgi:hypothetical protein
MKPAKPAILRVPLRPPPSPEQRAARRLELGKMKRAEDNEAAEEATERARATMPWFGRVAEERPYSASGYWLFLIKEAV